MLPVEKLKHPSQQNCIYEQEPWVRGLIRHSDEEEGIGRGGNWYMWLGIGMRRVTELAVNRPDVNYPVRKKH